MEAQEVGGMFSPFLARWRYSKAASYINKIGGRVLDVGCGSGGLREYLVNDCTYYGVDVLDLGERNFPFSTFDLNSDSELLFDKKQVTFDWIVMLAIVEHIDNPVEAIMHLKRFLEPGGKLLITTPHPRSRLLHDWGARVGLFSREASEEHTSFLDLSDFEGIARDTDLQLTTFERFMGELNQLVVLES